jgi:hypothetical protein
MRDAVPDWEVPVSAWEPLVNASMLPDAGDRHVVAAAVAGHADCIVTSAAFPRMTPSGRTVSRLSIPIASS